MIKIESDIIQKRLNEAELFSRKFGTFSKSDYEILMFTIYLDSLSKSVRDYDISVALGIPESKVRNLRIKSQLLYPRKIEWIQELKDAISHGYYDSATGQITITIEDPSVRSYIKNRIEADYGVVGLTLNNKQMVLPIESFLMLAALAEKDPDQAIKRLNTLLKSEIKTKYKIEKKSFKERFLKSIPDVVNFVCSTLTIYETGKPIVEELIKIINQ